MGLADLLHLQRVHLVPENGLSMAKPVCLEVVARVIAETTALDGAAVLRVLRERESLQSTGLGESVAIPHGALEELEHPVAAMILSRPAIDFDAIDGRPVHIIVGVLSPRRAAGEHLKTLARISRVLRTQAFRTRLLGATNAAEVLALIVETEGAVNP